MMKVGFYLRESVPQNTHTSQLDFTVSHIRSLVLYFPLKNDLSLSFSPILIVDQVQLPTSLILICETAS